jgi:hypothetical protein
MRAENEPSCVNPRQVCEHYADHYTRAAEQAHDDVFRKVLFMLALQWKLAAQEEAAKPSTGNQGQ